MLSIMFKKRKLVILFLCTIGIAVVILLPKGIIFLSSIKSSINKETRFFYIKESSSLQRLADRLVKEGFIADRAAFISVGEYKGLTTKEIAIGKYEIKPSTSFRTRGR